MARSKRVGLLLAVAALALAAEAALAADPAVPGPFPVIRRTYDDGDLAFTPGGFPSAVEVRASVHHPFPLSSGPFPLVVFLHGRHATCFDGAFDFLQWPCSAGRQPIPSFEGYDYIADTLASHGYIVVSISANGINAADNGVLDLGMQARAELIQHHLDKWQTFSTVGGAPFGTIFVGNVDLQNIGTMGHSRGGEGVVRHFVHNAAQGSPYGVNAVLPLAPTDFNRDVINNVELGVVLPYCDGDVADLQGVHFYDDARYNVPQDASFKHTLLVMGANHNFFNTIWTPGLFPAGTADDWNEFQVPADPFCGNVAGNGRLSDAEQRGAGAAYIVGFFRRHLGAETQFMNMLIGAEPPPPSALGATVHASFHAPRDLRKDINRQTSFFNRFINSVGGLVIQSGLSPYRICGGSGLFQAAKCLAGEPDTRQPHTTPSARSTKRGLSQLSLGWDGTSARYTNAITMLHRNLSPFFALQFRVGVNYDDPRNPAGLPQDFSVVLTDGNGATASVRVSDVSDALFYPPGDRSLFGMFAPNPVPKLFLNMVRIPLAAFIGVDLTDVESIEMRFDQNPAGALMISDLAVANVARPLDVFFLVDLSGSFGDDLPQFKLQAPAIIAALQAFSSDTRFGLGTFVDYPISPFGSAFSGDYAYRREIDLTTNTAAVLAAINGLGIFFGFDGPESQLVALYQAATGAGQDLSGEGFPGASIPAGQQASFRDGVTKIFLLWTDAPFHRPGDPGTIPYPGPSFQDTVDAILALDPPMVVGISSGFGGVPDLQQIAAATGAIAPRDIDCDDDGTVDILKGEPLVCSISTTGAGISEAVVSLVIAAGEAGEGGLTEVAIDVKPGSDPARINLASRGVIPVAILTTSTAAGELRDFDATTVDPQTVLFGPGAAQIAHKDGHVEDVDGDGDLDLMLHFRTQEAAIFEGQTIVSLTGFTFDLEPIEGFDTIETFSP